MRALSQRLCAGRSEQHHVRARVDRNADDTDDHDDPDDAADYSAADDHDNTANTLHEWPGAHLPWLRVRAYRDDTVHRDDTDPAGEPNNLHGRRGVYSRPLSVPVRYGA